jgi:hypothetical protein
MRVVFQDAEKRRKRFQSLDGNGVASRKDTFCQCELGGATTGHELKKLQRRGFLKCGHELS